MVRPAFATEEWNEGREGQLQPCIRPRVGNECSRAPMDSARGCLITATVSKTRVYFRLATRRSDLYCHRVHSVRATVGGPAARKEVVVNYAALVRRGKARLLSGCESHAATVASGW